MENKPQITLNGLYGLGLIILRPSGVVYSNQTGGFSCLQSKAEGVLVPLYDEVNTNQEKLLYEYFTGSKWFGNCSYGIDEETANVIEEILNLSLHTNYISVNRDRLIDSHEAWIYVKLLEPSSIQPLDYVTVSDSSLIPSFYTIYGFGNCDAVLTWNNSD